MKNSTSRAAVLAVAATLALSACTQDDKATFDSTGTQQSGASAPASSGAEGEATSAVVEPAKGRTIEVNETKTASAEGRAFSLTVHKVVIKDYHVETEITLVNDTAEPLRAWYPSEYSGPQLFDEAGRKYLFQGQADGKQLTLQGGEGVNAVLVHAGRVDPEARTLTIDFTGLDSSRKELWSQITFDVPVGSN